MAQKPASHGFLKCDFSVKCPALHPPWTGQRDVRLAFLHWHPLRSRPEDVRWSWHPVHGQMCKGIQPMAALQAIDPDVPYLELTPQAMNQSIQASNVFWIWNPAIHDTSVATG